MLVDNCVMYSLVHIVSWTLSIYIYIYIYIYICMQSSDYGIKMLKLYDIFKCFFFVCVCVCVCVCMCVFKEYH